MKARPSSTWMETRGSWYGWPGVSCRPSREIWGSISTASTWRAPRGGGRGLNGRARGEGGNAGNAAGDVRGVGVEGPDRDEGRGHPRRNRDHHQGNRQEDERQRDPDRHPRRVEVAEVDDLAAGA